MVARKKKAKPAPSHTHSSNRSGEWLRDIILGGQDGLVNVLGIVLGVATATSDVRIVIVSGLAAMFAEGISMGAVAYTSTKAEQEYYSHELARESDEVKKNPRAERSAIRRIFFEKGFRGKTLANIVERISSNKSVWVKTLLGEQMPIVSMESPLRSAMVVMFAALAGAFFPLIPFFLFPVQTAAFLTVPFSLVILFISGALKGRFTHVPWIRSGIEMAVIGTGAALVGYVIGALLSVPVA